MVYPFSSCSVLLSSLELSDTNVYGPYTQPSRRCPLHCAAACGHTPVAKQLIALGADVSASDADGWTPLHLAASQVFTHSSSTRTT